jgi:aerobic-type carbon monoxide dehydrogenase small subunit (CoxS/CutS family)
MAVRLTVNGDMHEVDAPGDERLLATLRDRLELTGTKLVCGRGECGACTVLIDGRLAYSCLTLTQGCHEQSITTIEGLGSDGVLDRVQRAFVDHDAAQCGFCTPGQVLAAVALLEKNAHPSDAEITRGMSGNLCRCGTYPNIRLALESLARR